MFYFFKSKFYFYNLSKEGKTVLSKDAIKVLDAENISNFRKRACSAYL